MALRGPESPARSPCEQISKFEHGLLDTAMTHRYRREILEPGGSRSAMAMVESFLGRPFSLDAWAATISAPPARP